LRFRISFFRRGQRIDSKWRLSYRASGN